MSSQPEKPDPLAPLLDDAEEELKRRLHEACSAEADSVPTKTSAEIRELEDSLLAAAVAARQTLALREKMGERDTEGTADAGAPRSDASPPAGDETRAALDAGTVTGVREFNDSIGRAWRAWLVTPAASRSGLGKFQEGWICFETLDNTARRRLPCRRAVWSDLHEEELETLLEQAINVPERKGIRPAQRPASRDRDTETNGAS